MSQNIFEKSQKLNELFRDVRILYPEFVPEKLPHRNKEIDELVYAFEPVLKGRKPLNVVLLGGTGTGKTVTAKYVLKELEEYSDRAKSLYINCFEFNSRPAVLTAIANFLGQAVPRRGLATDETYSKVLEALKKINFVPLIILDEVDQLLQKQEGSSLLYDLLRVIEFGKAHIGIILISNDFAFSSRLEQRVKSSLAQHTITFEQYSPLQLKDILRERVQFAFLPGKLEEEVINVSAAHAAKKGGDARIAIDCLLKAGRVAEQKNSSKVTLQHLKEVLASIGASQAQKALPFLNQNEKAVIEAISKSPEGICSGDLFKKYKTLSKNPLTQRQFRSILSKFEKMKILRAEEVAKKKRGRTRKIFLCSSKEALKELLAQAEQKTSN